MKNLIIITSIILLILFSISISYAGPDKPYYLQWVSVTYKNYVGEKIIIDTIDGNQYIGKCLSISDNIITIKYTKVYAQVLTIPMHQIKKFWMVSK